MLPKRKMNPDYWLFFIPGIALRFTYRIYSFFLITLKPACTQAFTQDFETWGMKLF